MRIRALLLSSIMGSLGMAWAQSSGQFLFTLMDGRTFVRMLEPDWQPRFEGGFLYLTPRDRMLSVDLAAMQPVHPDDVTGRHQVKLLFRSHLGRGSQLFWVPDAYRNLEDAPHKDGFLVLGPQTLVREGIYRVVVE